MRDPETFFRLMAKILRDRGDFDGADRMLLCALLAQRERPMAAG